tara:strand:+ start:2667 stop:3329 length:663 start_codon:yes stop_codon:yes gene_type:complete
MLVLLFSLLAKMVIHRAQKKKIPLIVMPYVERTPNTLNSALISLEKTRGLMPVLLVGGTPGYITPWCTRFDCIEATPVPQALIEHAIRSDQRGDSKQFLRWRTTEAWDALFALNAFLKTKREYLIWLQDDVEVIDLFNLPDHDLICLRVGNKYCGMVAYKMKRTVVERFVVKIKQQMHVNPIDWILDDVRQEMMLTLHRFPKVLHKGEKSSNAKKRNVDV